MYVFHAFILLRPIYLTEVSPRDCALFFRENGKTVLAPGSFFLF